MEQWKTLIYQGVSYLDFEVSTLGKIKNLKTGTIYKLTIGKTGYYQVCVSLGSRKTHKAFKVHKAVAETFIPNPDNKPIVNHIDGNKLNNCVENLEWTNHSENVKHAIANDLLIIGSGVDSFNAKLTQNQIDFIRKNYIPRDSKYGCRALASKFKVSHTTISDIVHYKIYKT